MNKFSENDNVSTSDISNLQKQIVRNDSDIDQLNSEKVSRDGSVAMTANLNMSNNQIIDISSLSLNETNGGSILNTNVIDSRNAMPIQIRGLNADGAFPPYTTNIQIVYNETKLNAPLDHNGKENKNIVIGDSSIGGIDGLLRLNSNNLQLYLNNVWNNVLTTPNSLYEFTSFTFTSGGASGRFGPTLSQLQSNYNTVAYPWINDTSFFKMTDHQGYQEWCVPTQGEYKIECVAAGSQGSTAGRGFRQYAQFTLTKGEFLQIVVGQQGIEYNTKSSGGGGASWVVRAPYTSTSNVLMVSGGGGGQYLDTASNYLEDAIYDSNIGNGRAGSYAAAGTNGYGGQGNTGSGASGGGGFLSQGSNGTFGTGGGSFLNGLVGGTSNAAPCQGGFGGGGGTHGNTAGGGGGGGYSGGFGGFHNTPYGNGGAGGSKTASNLSFGYSNSYNSGNGYVIITKL